MWRRGHGCAVCIGDRPGGAQERRGPAVISLTGRDPCQALKAPCLTQEFVDLVLEHQRLREQACRSLHIGLSPCRNTQTPKRIGTIDLLAQGLCNCQDLIEVRDASPLVFKPDALSEHKSNFNLDTKITRSVKHFPPRPGASA
jgi:hypothetical protein